MDDNSQTRIAAVGDIHYTKTSKGKLHDLFVDASSSADVLLLAVISLIMVCLRKRGSWRKISELMFGFPSLQS
jgi:hypothetical protein